MTDHPTLPIDDGPPCPLCGQPLAQKEPRYRRPDGDVHVRCFEGPRVLIVDDDPILRELVSDRVGRQRICKIHTASHGGEALERIRTYVYDLILCDLRMPEMDGPTFYRQMQADYPKLVSSIVFMTAHARDDEYAAFIRDVGARLLDKPFPKEELDEILARMIGPTPSRPETK
jgi:CheY-like chemotaxis protein